MNSSDFDFSLTKLTSTFKKFKGISLSFYYVTLKGKCGKFKLNVKSIKNTPLCFVLVDSNCNEGDNTDHKSNFTPGCCEPNISHPRRLSSSRKPAAVFTPGPPGRHPPTHPIWTPGAAIKPGGPPLPPFHISLDNSFDAMAIILREIRKKWEVIKKKMEIFENFSIMQNKP